MYVYVYIYMYRMRDEYATLAGLVGGRLAVNCDITYIRVLAVGGVVAFDPCTIPSSHTPYFIPPRLDLHQRTHHVRPRR